MLARNRVQHLGVELKISFGCLLCCSLFRLFSSRALISLFQVQALEPEAESMEDAPEELLERLAQTEKLVVQLKDLIREKDALLQQKETVLKVSFLSPGTWEQE